jgi:hypothetical protein
VVLTKVLFMLMHIQYIYTVCIQYKYTHLHWKPVHQLRSWSGYRRVHTLMIIWKPEKFQLVMHGAFVTPCGIADLNSNDNIMKQNSNHTH